MRVGFITRRGGYDILPNREWRREPIVLVSDVDPTLYTGRPSERVATVATDEQTSKIRRADE